MNTDDARTIYADIFDLPHHQSSTRKHMSLYDRAAQFAPFAALSGFDDMVVEEARLTEREIELSESEINMINEVIGSIADTIRNGGHPTVSITYFRPDSHKSGGSYETISGIVKKVDPVSKLLILYGSNNTLDRRIPPIMIKIERLIHISIRTSGA